MLKRVETVSGSRGSDGGGGAVEVEVTDDGKAPGIPADVDVDPDSGTTPRVGCPNPRSPSAPRKRNPPQCVLRRVLQRVVPAGHREWTEGHDLQERESKRSTQHLGKNLSLGEIVVSSKLAILHAETLAPEGKMLNRRLLS
jgi:hypothetical protein